jgi:hypothetical protein
MVGSGSGTADGVAVSGMCAKVGNSVDVAGTQAVKKTNRLQGRKKRRNISKL